MSIQNSVYKILYTTFNIQTSVLLYVFPWVYPLECTLSTLLYQQYFNFVQLSYRFWKVPHTICTDLLNISYEKLYLSWCSEKFSLKKVCGKLYSLTEIPSNINYLKNIEKFENRHLFLEVKLNLGQQHPHSSLICI